MLERKTLTAPGRGRDGELGCWGLGSVTLGEDSDPQESPLCILATPSQSALRCAVWLSNKALTGREETNLVIPTGLGSHKIEVVDNVQTHAGSPLHMMKIDIHTCQAVF